MKCTILNRKVAYEKLTMQKVDQKVKKVSFYVKL